MLKARHSSLARRDILDAAVFIAEDSPESARRFLQAVEDTVLWLRRFPRMGAAYPHPDSQDLRAKLVTGFSSYVVFYTVGEKAIEVRRVLHGARDLPSVLSDEPS